MMKMKCKLPCTMHRVPIKTCPHINSKIRNQTIINLNHYKGKGKEAIAKRIKQLDQEWDTERTLETHAGSLIIISTFLGLKMHRCCYIVSGIVGFFMLQHALFGWCPSLPFIRKMGIRTTNEINHEKTVLKILRGDFNNISSDVKDLYNMVIKK